MSRRHRLALAAGALALTGSAPGYPDQSAILAEINALRADPHRYAAALRAYRTGFEGNIHHDPGDPVGWETDEGAAAVDEAIAALDRQRPLAALAAAPVLAAAAGDHGAEQGTTGGVGHGDDDGSTPSTRVARRGGGIYVGEVIAYGSVTAADVVRQLIIDDGVADRGHRALLLDGAYRYAGVWCGPHPDWRAVCVIDVAETPDGRE